MLLVVWWHYFNTQAGVSGSSPEWLKLLWQSTSLAWSGVDLFFVLSGFLITGILLDESKAPNLLRVFFARRSARILPLYLLLLALAGGSYLLLGSRPAFNWLYQNLPPVSALLTFTQNIVMGAQSSFGGRFLGMTWSLAVEEQFYLLWPWIVLLFTKRRHLLLVSFGLCLLAPCLRMDAPYLTGTVNMPFRMDALLLGAMAAIVVREARAVKLLKSKPYLLGTLLAITGVAVAVLARFNRLVGAWDHFVLGLFYVTVLLQCVVFQGGLVARLLSAGWLRQCGMISYALYMFHEPAAGLLHGAIFGAEPSIKDVPGLGITLLSLAVALLAAWLSTQYFESRFLKWGHRFKYRRPEPQPVSEARISPDACLARP